MLFPEAHGDTRASNSITTVTFPLWIIWYCPGWTNSARWSKLCIRWISLTMSVENRRSTFSGSEWCDRHGYAELHRIVEAIGDRPASRNEITATFMRIQMAASQDDTPSGQEARTGMQTHSNVIAKSDNCLQYFIWWLSASPCWPFAGINGRLELEWRLSLDDIGFETAKIRIDED
jgi:hypothetical protein